MDSGTVELPSYNTEENRKTDFSKAIRVCEGRKSRLNASLLGQDKLVYIWGPSNQLWGGQNILPHIRDSGQILGLLCRRIQF